LAFGLVAIAPWLAFAAPVPKILIIQLSQKQTKGDDPNLPFVNFFAQEVDDAGKMTSIVWGMTDPVFREAAMSGKIKNAPDHPKLDEVFPVARDLGAEYVVVCEATKAGTDVTASATLYKDGREIWKDKENMGVAKVSGFDSQSSAHSVARTMVLKMGGTILKGLMVQQKAQTPEAAQGQSPVETPVTPPAPAKLDDDALKTDVDALVKQKNITGAIAMLRDAIDIAPFDAVRRSMLIEVLKDRDPKMAADEAKRAGALLPDHPEFRILAAKALMNAGSSKEALEELNQAIARAPNAPSTRLLLAEMSIRKLEPEKALPHLDEAMKAENSADCHFLRAVCDALLGKPDGVRSEIEAMDKQTTTKNPSDVARHHNLAIAVLDQQMAKDADEIRTLTQRAIIKPKDPDTNDRIRQIQRSVAARGVLLAMIASPIGDQPVHDRWVLAHKLLAQSLLDLQSFTGGSEDSLTDARLNFSQAIEEAEKARNPVKDP